MNQQQQLPLQQLPLQQLPLQQQPPLQQLPLQQLPLQQQEQQKDEIGLKKSFVYSLLGFIRLGIIVSLFILYNYNDTKYKY
jgi:hypothetical protein